MDEIKKIIFLLLVLSVFGLALIGIAFGYLEPTFNYIAYVSFVVDALIFISIGIVLFFIITLVAISIPISNIGKYYLPDSEYGVEKAITKNVKIILVNNLILTIPLYFSIIYLLNPSNFFTPTQIADCTTQDLKSAFIVALAVIPAFLLSLRLLTNPILGKIPIFNEILVLLRNHYSTTESPENIRERFMSFYFSITASAFFVMIMLYLYKSIPLNLSPFDVPVYLINSLEKSFVPIFDPTLIGNTIRIGLFIIAYLLILFVLTSFGEIILDRYKKYLNC